MEYLRSVRFWVVTVVMAVGAIIACWLITFPRICGPDDYVIKGGKCPDSGVDTLILTVYGRQGREDRMEEDSVRYQDGDMLVKKQVKVPYVCNEVILSPSLVTPAKAEEWRNYLRCLGFTLTDSCSCTDKLELWRYNGDKHIYTIGVVEDPKPDKARPSGEGLSLNYVIDMPPLENFIADSSNFETRNPAPTLNRGTVKIAVTDTGVDPFTTFPLSEYLWKEGQTSAYQCPSQPAGKNGLNLYPSLGMLEPMDKLGHGTHVTGIIIGVPGAKAGYQDNVPFQIITAKIIDDASNGGTLFNAVCGLYYGLHQGAKVFNVSWGYLDTMRDESYKIFEPFLKEVRDSQAVVVAAMGNNSVYLDQGARFWPASFAESWENVLSVGAVDSNYRLAYFSNWSNVPNMMSVTALGVDVVSSIPVLLQKCPRLAQLNNSKICAAKCSGTSMAAPFVTRTAAVIEGKFARIPAQEVKERIMNQAVLFYRPVPYRVLNHAQSIL